MAKAISLTPTQRFEGNNGNWSTFYVMVGDDSQAYRVLPATSQSATWLIPTDACDESIVGVVPPECDDLRGGTFDRSAAYSGVDFTSIPNAQAWMMPYTDAEIALDNQTYGGSGWGGTSSVILGGERSDASVSNQAIAFPVDSTPFFGLIGLSGRSAQITPTQDYDSVLMALNKSAQIPGRYWAYHAGASYASPPVFGSVTFGGYDSRRGDVESFVVPFYSENTREFLVNIPVITISSSSFSPVKTFPSNLNAMIDSLVTEIWLPPDICDDWESKFNLTWNETYQIYTLDTEQHENLLDLNPNITFTLAKNSTAPESDRTDIILPYAAFDLSISFWPEGDNSSGQYYFPIKRAADDSQYVLGRTFLQEAYVTADYDRKQFSVSQAIMNGGSNMVEVLPDSTDSTPTLSPNPNQETGSDGLSSGAIAGIVIGVVVAAVAAFGLFYWFFWRPRKQRKQESAAKYQREESVATFDTFGASTLAAPAYDYHRASSVGVDPLFVGVDNKIGNEQKEKQELDATFTARARAASDAMGRHELAAGSVRHPSETRSGRGSISPLAERRPGHARTTSDTPSLGVSTWQSISGPNSPPIFGHQSPPLDSQGRPSPPLSDMQGWFGGPIYELQAVPRSVPEAQEVSATELRPHSKASVGTEPQSQQNHVIEAEDPPRESVSVSEVTSEDEAPGRVSDVTETPVNETGPGTRLL